MTHAHYLSLCRHTSRSPLETFPRVCPVCFPPSSRTPRNPRLSSKVLGSSIWLLSCHLKLPTKQPRSPLFFFSCVLVKDQPPRLFQAITSARLSTSVCTLVLLWPLRLRSSPSESGSQACLANAPDALFGFVTVLLHDDLWE